MKRCPKCHATFERPEADRCDDCGWSKRKETKQTTREPWGERLYPRTTHTKACAERSCIKQSKIGTDLCAKHSDLPRESINFYDKPTRFKSRFSLPPETHELLSNLDTEAA